MVKIIDYLVAVCSYPHQDIRYGSCDRICSLIIANPNTQFNCIQRGIFSFSQINY
jgi:hypothetical protein